MSPEQCRGDETVTPLSDVYSLGALGYFLVTGVPPSTWVRRCRSLAAHLHEIPRPIRDLRGEVPAVLASVLERCLAKDPFERYPSAARLEEALLRSIG